VISGSGTDYSKSNHMTTATTPYGQNVLHLDNHVAPRSWSGTGNAVSVTSGSTYWIINPS
jgi:hypothetical protein